MGLQWLLLAVTAPALAAQEQPAPPWQVAAGGKMAFEVASIKLDKGEFRSPNFPLDDGDAYKPNGGRFSADFPLITYIQFAYKIRFSPDQLQAMMPRLPKWVASDRFDIQARAEGTPTKDQMRLMMQSLLAERFQLVVHFETQQAAVLALTLVKSGNTGPKLRPHSEGPPCDAPPSPAIFPAQCDIQSATMKPDRTVTIGSRNTTVALMANALSSVGRLGRPIVDQTGLTGKFDFTLEWLQEPNGPAAPGAEPPADLPGPTFLEALREQLGLRLESTKAPLQILLIDRLERPSEN